MSGWRMHLRSSYGCFIREDEQGQVGLVMWPLVSHRAQFQDWRGMGNAIRDFPSIHLLWNELPDTWRSAMGRPPILLTPPFGSPPLYVRRLHVLAFHRRRHWRDDYTTAPLQTPRPSSSHPPPVSTHLGIRSGLGLCPALFSG